MSAIPFKDLDLNSIGEEPDNDGVGGVVDTISDRIEVNVEENHEMGTEEERGLESLGNEDVERERVGALVGEEWVGKVDINANVVAVNGVVESVDDQTVGTLGGRGAMEVEFERKELGGDQEGRVGALVGGETVDEGGLDMVDINADVVVVDGVTETVGEQNMGSLVCDIDTDVVVVDGVTETDEDQNMGTLVCDINSDVVVVDGVTETVEDQNIGTLVCDISVSPEEGREAMEVDVGRKESDGLSKQDGGQSQIGFYECDMGSLVVDLGPAFGKEADGNVIDGGGVGKEIVVTTNQVARIEQPKEGGFSNSDLVWGKVKSHPWWPGQIMDPSFASELAMKFYKKDTYLVAYFGDQSFAWNEPLTLKSFKDNFSQLEKQTNAVAFCDAVNCALDEISRRVQLDLSCSCIPEEIYNMKKSQIVVNAGVQESLCITDGVDRSFDVTSFEPSQLLEYVKSLALYQGNVGGRMGLVIAQAQIVAFYSSKGYFQLPEFHVSSLLSEHAEDATPVYRIEEKVHSRSGRGKPRRQNKSNTKALVRLEDSLKSRKKERSLTELMEPKKLLIGYNEKEKGGSESVIPYSGTKRKNSETSSSDTTAKKSRQRLISSTDRDADTESPISRDPKVGQRFRNIARQLSGSPPVLKFSGDSVQKSDFKVGGKSNKLHEVGVSTQIDIRTLGLPITVPREYSSPEEMLSQLCLAARDPMKGYSFVSIVVDFFTDFRNSTALGRSLSMQFKNSEKKVSGGEKLVRKIKQSNTRVHSTESYDYDAVSDSYWTDRVILSSPDEQVSHKKQKRKTDSLAEIPLKSSTTFELITSHDLSPVSDSKKDISTLESVNELQLNPAVDYTQKCTDENSNLVTEKSVVDNKNSEEIPTVLILNFTDAKSIPLESDLNRIFSKYGCLKESETKILRKTKRARVVFVRRIDAEDAFTRALKFSVFGPAYVSSQLSPLKASPCTRRQTRDGAASLKGNSN